MKSAIDTGVSPRSAQPGTGGTLTHLCRLQQFYWHMYKMPSPPLITVPGSQTRPLRAA
jgi:hypothetical protein